MAPEVCAWAYSAQALKSLGFSWHKNSGESNLSDRPRPRSSLVLDRGRNRPDRDSYNLRVARPSQVRVATVVDRQTTLARMESVPHPHA